MNKDINFLPERLIKSRQRKKTAVVLGFTSLLVIAVLYGAMLVPVSTAQKYQLEINEVNRKIIELETAKPLFEEKQRLAEALNKDKASLDDIKSRRLNVTGILEEINSILPKNCYVTYLAVKDKSDFTIEVVTNNPVETARVQVGLNSLGLFERVKLSDLKEVPLTDEAQPIRFELKLLNTMS